MVKLMLKHYIQSFVKEDEGLKPEKFKIRIF